MNAALFDRSGTVIASIDEVKISQESSEALARFLSSKKRRCICSTYFSFPPLIVPR